MQAECLFRALGPILKGMSLAGSKIASEHGMTCFHSGSHHGS